MEQAKLKYRIVGGVVLLALAAILVPLLGGVRQPLPQGPQPIDIPAEPSDGVASHLSDGDTPLKGDVPEPQDLPAPLPAPPLAQEGDATPADGLPEDDQAAPVAPSAHPAPANPPRLAPVPKPAPTKAEPSPAAKPPVPKAAAAAPVAPKPAPAPKAIAQAPVAAATPPKPVPAPAAPEPVPPVAKAAAAPPTAQQAWVVQLGVYGNVKTAIDLRESLRKAGHSAFTEEVATPQGKALRVRVGPELDHAKAQALRDRLARETGHDGIVVAYP